MDLVEIFSKESVLRNFIFSMKSLYQPTNTLAVHVYVGFYSQVTQLGPNKKIVKEVINFVNLIVMLDSFDVLNVFEEF